MADVDAIIEDCVDLIAENGLNLDDVRGGATDRVRNPTVTSMRGTGAARADCERQQ